MANRCRSTFDIRRFQWKARDDNDDGDTLPYVLHDNGFSCLRIKHDKSFVAVRV